MKKIAIIALACAGTFGLYSSLWSMKKLTQLSQKSFQILGTQASIARPYSKESSWSMEKFDHASPINKLTAPQTFAMRAYSKYLKDFTPNNFVLVKEQEVEKTCPCPNDALCRQSGLVLAEQSKYGFEMLPNVYRLVKKNDSWLNKSITCTYVSVPKNSDISQHNQSSHQIILPHNFDCNEHFKLLPSILQKQMLDEIRINYKLYVKDHKSHDWMGQLQAMNPNLRLHYFAMIYDLASHRYAYDQGDISTGCLRHEENNKKIKKLETVIRFSKIPGEQQTFSFFGGTLGEKESRLLLGVTSEVSLEHLTKTYYKKRFAWEKNQAPEEHINHLKNAYEILKKLCHPA